MCSCSCAPSDDEATATRAISKCAAAGNIRSPFTLWSLMHSSQGYSTELKRCSCRLEVFECTSGCSDASDAEEVCRNSDNKVKVRDLDIFPSRKLSKICLIA